MTEPRNFARYAHVTVLEEGQLGMLPEHRQRRRINAARRLGRIHVTRKARQLGLIADDWQESTIEGNFDASIDVRISARFTADPDAPTVPTVPFHDIGAMNDLARAAEIPPELRDLLTAGPSSAEAFEAWQAPRRAAYEAARDAAIERLAPAFEQLGRMIDDIANPPRYVTIDEEHVLTADQLAGLHPGQIWITSTGNEREKHRHALDLLDELGDLLDAMHTGPDMAGRATTVRSVLIHHIDAIRRLVLHHHDLEDPAGAEHRARTRRLAGRPAHETTPQA